MNVRNTDIVYTGLLLIMALGLLFLFATGCAYLTGPKTYETSDIAYQGTLDGNYGGSNALIFEYAWVKACMGVENPVPYPQVKIYKCPELKEGEGCLIPCGDKYARTCYQDKVIGMPNKTVDYPEMRRAMANYIMEQIGEFNATYLEKCKGSN